MCMLRNTMLTQIIITFSGKEPPWNWNTPFLHGIIFVVCRKIIDAIVINLHSWTPNSSLKCDCLSSTSAHVEVPGKKVEQTFSSNISQNDADGKAVKVYAKVIPEKSGIKFGTHKHNLLQVFCKSFCSALDEISRKLYTYFFDRS